MSLFFINAGKLPFLVISCKMGATTIWERWDGIKPDSSFQTPGMNSFNHYAYGAIGDWMYRVAAGIDTYEEDPGYKHIRIQPHIGGGLTNASATLQTYYGKVASGWKTEGDKIIVDIDIPANTKATVYLPAANADMIKENGAAVSSSKDIEVAGTENGYVELKTGSGKYQFTISK
jgi:alpha-L-rhamnosidase